MNGVGRGWGVEAGLPAELARAGALPEEVVRIDVLARELDGRGRRGVAPLQRRELAEDELCAVLGDLPAHGRLLVRPEQKQTDHF